MRWVRTDYHQLLQYLVSCLWPVEPVGTVLAAKTIELNPLGRGGR